MVNIGVVGAGTMGSGIAQVAATHGCIVRIGDLEQDFIRAAIAGIAARLDRAVQKGKLSAADMAAILARLHVADGAKAFGDCDLIIEAVAEDMNVKAGVLEAICPHVTGAAIFASNTSSLSITELGRRIGQGRRMVGMHFFNPVPLMPLVEVIAGGETDQSVADRAADVARSWGKTVVRAKDSPGFIVNRVARGYYLESLRMLDEGIGGVDEIDRTLKTLGGFRMGPFELMDLIGIDVNYSVSVSVWEQLARPERLQPHPIQRDLFDKGCIGRKSGRGFYLYESTDAPPLPAVIVDRRSFDCPAKVYEAVRRIVDKAVSVAGSITEQYIFSRVLATIINEAALLHDEGNAGKEDIDTAMKLGTNYPHGPLEWAERIGRRTCAGLLRALNQAAATDRFTPAQWLTA